MVGVEGVEPSPRGPRPRILPLYDTPIIGDSDRTRTGDLLRDGQADLRYFPTEPYLVGVTGFEPATFGLRVRYSAY